MLLDFTWWACPSRHSQLLDEEQIASGRKVYCLPCAKHYTVDEGVLGDKETVDYAFPNLLG